MNDRGFTLLELLVALALLAAISVALTQSVGVGAQVWRKTEVFPERDARIALRHHLRTWIEAATPAGQRTRPRQHFEGDGAGFRFLTEAPIGQALSGDLKEVKVTVSGESNAEKELVIELTLTSADGSIRLSERRTLINHTGPIDIRYFAPGRSAFADEHGRWRERWLAADGLPALVSISVTDRADWPPFVVAPILGR